MTPGRHDTELRPQASASAGSTMSHPTRRSVLGAAWTVPLLSAAAVIPGATASNQPEPPGWRLLGVHPQAAEEPRDVGRQIRDIEIFGGRVFLGYGDYGENTGPVAINPYDPSLRSFVGVLHEAYTHQISVWRQVSFGLVAPDIDPLQDVPDDPLDPNGGMTWSGDGASWSHVVVGPSFHVFDFADGGSNRWIVGSAKANGSGAPTVWRRTGGGAWRVSYQGDAELGANAARYYWVAVVNGVPYVQARGTTTVRPIRFFDAASGAWQAVSGISQQLHQSGQPQHVQVSGQFILSASGGGIRRFDTQSETIRVIRMPNGQAVKDIYVRGPEVFALTAGMIFRSTNNGTDFAAYLTSMPDATALAVGDGVVYIGTMDAALYAWTIG